MKKGFTLLELLAVIVVLAIIALIAIPIITNVIEKAKQGSAVDSAYGYIDTIEKSVALGQIDSSKGLIIPDDNELNMAEIADAEMLDSISIKGTKPEYALLTFENKKVVSAGFCIDGYNVKYENKKASITSENYCSYVNVEDIIVNNSEINWNGNIGETMLSPNQDIDLNIVAVTKDGTSFNDVHIIEDTQNDTVELVGNRIVANAMGMETIMITAGIRFKKVIVTVSNDSILGYLGQRNFGSTGEHDNVEITANGVTYNAHVYNFEGKQVWTTKTVPNAGKFGSSSDIGTASSPATKMVIIKVNGDLTIDSGVTIYPNYDSYGGPKGFLVYVTGTLINNGTIDNSHGAYAQGENVYLWKNANNEYEVIPAVGGAGGLAYTTGAKETAVHGNKGSDGDGRKTGGGGSGAGIHGDSTGYAQIYPGGTGTSYSGGTGSGGINENSKEGPTNGREAGINGGSGGIGRVYRYSASWAARTACGGTGNPGGAGASHVSGDKSNEGNNSNYKGNDGTGGLLIIFGSSIINNGLISANGTDSVNCVPAGGASGAGSINIFYRGNYSSTGQINAFGGNYNNSYTGGVGGNGSITIGSIATGTFVSN